MTKAVLLGVIAAGTLSLHAEALVVASGENGRFGELSREQLRELYGARTFRAGGERIVLLNLEADHPLRRKFEQTVLDANREGLCASWLEAHYQGHPPPKVFKTPQSVAEFLVRVNNAIGYLDAATARKYRLKILYEAGE